MFGMYFYLYILVLILILDNLVLPILVLQFLS